MNDGMPNYILLSAAKNEEELIGKVLESVIAQAVLPVRWTIVSDGSTDRTAEIVRGYADDHSWIKLIELPPRETRDFAGKAKAVTLAYQESSGLDFEIVGNLDSDVSFQSDYFEFLMAKFRDDPDLGVAGTPYVEQDGRGSEKRSDHRHGNPEHVSGQVQLFRRACFDEVGGYLPVKGGAIDWIAVTTARMKGWKTRSFPEKTFYHHRKMGTASSTVLGSRFHYGKKAYYVGGHPCWEMLRGFFQMAKTPIFLGGLMHQAGYVWAALTRMERPVIPELMKFHRTEQMMRLKRLIGGKDKSP